MNPELPLIAESLLSSFASYGEVNYKTQGLFNYPGSGCAMGWTGPGPVQIPEDQITASGGTAIPASCWVLQLTLRHPNGERLSLTANKLMKLGILNPGSYSHISYARKTITEIEEIHINAHELKSGDTIIHSPDDDDELYIVSRQVTKEVENRDLCEFTFSIPYPLLEEKQDYLEVVLAPFKGSSSF